MERPFSRFGRGQVSGEHGGFVLSLALGAVYVPFAGPALAAITVAGATDKIGLRPWRSPSRTRSARRSRP